MKKVLLVGCGRIGQVIAQLLLMHRYEVTIADASPQALRLLEERLDRCGLGLPGERFATRIIDAEHIERLLDDNDAVISACSFDANMAIANAALMMGTSYFDLTEDVKTTACIKALAQYAKDDQIFMPQCGLAPGYISIAANDLLRDFDSVEELKMRVGALPQFPSNALKYNLTWSPEGLINEYCNPCDAIEHGKKIQVAPMEGLEHITIDGQQYEAFNTSGGLGTLCESMIGRVGKLNYKTIRYPGHHHLMTFLLKDLKLIENQKTLVEIFKEAIPDTTQDVVITYVSAIGFKGGKLIEKSIVNKVTGAVANGEMLTAIQLTTASAICAAVDLHFSGKLPQKGFVAQDWISLDDFLSNKFGRAYLPKGR